MTKTYDLTNGKPSKLILNFFFPMLITNMLQQVYAIADTAIVGKGLGDNALAAVGNISSLTFLISTTSSVTRRWPLLISSRAASDLPIPDSPTIRTPSP